MFSIVYISKYIHANIRMDVANHIIDAYSYAAVLSLSYGDGEASFIHEVLIIRWISNRLVLPFCVSNKTKHY